MRNRFKTKGRDKWAEYIGKTILCFGDIEFITFECLINFSQDNIFKSTSNLSLNPRIGLIINIVENRFDKEVCAKFISLLNEVIKQAQKRNLIAHNPLNLDIYEDEIGDISEFKEVIYSLRNYDTKVSFDELISFYESVHSLSESLTKEYQFLYNKLVLE